MATAARKIKTSTKSKAKTKADVFKRIIKELPLDRSELIRLSKKAKCSVSTLDNWYWERTENPHINTLYRVADALGYDIILAKKDRKVSKINRK